MHRSSEKQLMIDFGKNPQQLPTPAPQEVALSDPSKNANSSTAFRGMSRKQQFAMWKSMQDHDFFSDAVHHLYLYDDVTSSSINALRNAVRAINAAVRTPSLDGVQIEMKPIVVHVNSVGGDYFTSLTFLAMFNESALPICAMIDGISYSAATNMSLFAPYRVMTENSMVLLHQWRMFVNHSVMMKRDDLQYIMDISNPVDEGIAELVLKRTRLSREALEELMMRDTYLDPDFCIKNGIVDRVLGASHRRRTPGFSMTSGPLPPPQALIQNVFNNHLFLNMDQNSPGNRTKTIVQQLDKHMTHESMYNQTIKPIILHSNEYNYDWNGYDCFQSISPIVTRLQIIDVPTIGVVESMLDILNMIPVLYCKHRLMYEHAALTISIRHKYGTSMLVQDIIDNSNKVMQWFRHVLKTRTRLPQHVLDNLHKRKFVFTAQQCLEYRVVDELIKVGGIGF